MRRGKKHCKGKGDINSSAYFDNKTVEEEEIVKPMDDEKYNECVLQHCNLNVHEQYCVI